MLTEINSTTYAIKVNGQYIIKDIPSYTLAESALYGLTPELRAVAEIVPLTTDGKSLLLG